MPRIHRPLVLAFLCIILSITGGRLRAQPAKLAHDLIVCASMTRDFTIGSRTTRDSGLFFIENRTTPRHFGFNHPRQDAVVADPRDRNILYTVGLNGVLGSRDNGATWRILTSWDMTEPKDIAIDPNQPDHLYIGLPDGIGVSHDAGETWTRMDDGIPRKYTQTLAVDRSRAGRVIAGTEKGIYLSEDGAVHWTLVQAADATVTDLDQSPHDPAVFMATTQVDGVLMSRDGGRSWGQLPGTKSGFTLYNGDFDATDPNRLAICGWIQGVQVSEDGGKTWSQRNEGLPNTNVWKIGVDPDIAGRLYASPHQEAVYISDDFGRSWRPGFFEGAVVWDFAFLPSR
ncbi:MAG: hypothetical protein R3F07_18440 [Opitutaceae bacterium]